MPVAFKPEPKNNRRGWTVLEFNPKTFFDPSFLMFIINVYYNKSTFLWSLDSLSFLQNKTASTQKIRLRGFVDPRVSNRSQTSSFCGPDKEYFQFLAQLFCWVSAKFIYLFTYLYINLLIRRISVQSVLLGRILVGASIKILKINTLGFPESSRINFRGHDD